MKNGLDNSEMGVNVEANEEEGSSKSTNFESHDFQGTLEEGPRQLFKELAKFRKVEKPMESETMNLCTLLWTKIMRMYFFKMPAL